MSKTVEKIVINSEGIDVISIQNGVNRVIQFDLELPENEIQDIFTKYNLNSIINYPFDIRIVRGLAENNEQLKDYLETCRRGNYSKGRVDIPNSIPKIEYDLRELKNSDLLLLQKIEMFKKAKETQNIFKNRIKLKMGILDRGYFVIQEFLQNRGKSDIQALAAGDIEQIRGIRGELKDENLTEKTNAIAKEFALRVSKRTTIKENNQEKV